MLDNKDFDLCADGYDKDVLGTIYNMVGSKEKAKILDIGFGTGVLTI